MKKLNSIVSAIFLALPLISASSAWAQSQPVSVADQRRTAAIIRSVDRTADATLVSIDRLGTNVGTLLTRLDSANATDMRLCSVAEYYIESSTAIRFRQIARIDRDVNRQLTILRSRANSESLQAELQAARDEAVTLIEDADGIVFLDICDIVRPLVSSPCSICPTP